MKERLFHTFSFYKIIFKDEDDNMEFAMQQIMKICDKFCWESKSFRVAYRRSLSENGNISLNALVSIEMTEAHLNSKIASMFAFFEAMSFSFFNHMLEGEEALR